MSNPLRAPRGTTAAITSRVLLDGELAYDTTLERLRVGDGTTLGGIVQVPENAEGDVEARLDALETADVAFTAADVALDARTDALEALLTATAFRPVSNDGLALGTAALSFSDLFLASGAVINFNNGDVTLTHSADQLTFSGFANSGAFALGSSTTVFSRTDQTVTAADAVTTRAEMVVANVTAGSGGFTIAGNFIAQDGGTWSATGNYGIQGILGEGIGTKASQRVWGGNLLARQTTAAAADVCGLEIDVDVRDVQATNRYGLQIVVPSAGTQDGATIDVALRVTNKVGGAAWSNGIWFDNNGGAAPIKTTGRILYASGGFTVTTGIDFSGITITGDFLSSTGFSVTGAGALTAASLTTAGAISGATAAGAVVATQANMESGAATNLLVSPGRQHFHPAHPKYFCNFDGTGTPAARSSFNHTSITDNGVGDYTLTMTTAFSTQASGCCFMAGASFGSPPGANDVTSNVVMSAAGTIAVRVRNNASGYIDITAVQVFAFGDH